MTKWHSTSLLTRNIEPHWWKFLQNNAAETWQIDHHRVNDAPRTTVFLSTVQRTDNATFASSPTPAIAAASSTTTTSAKRNKSVTWKVDSPLPTPRPITWRKPTLPLPPPKRKRATSEWNDRARQVNDLNYRARQHPVQVLAASTATEQDEQ